MNSNDKQILINNKKFKLLIGAEEIQSIIESMAERINTDYHGSEPVFVIILKGAIFFATDLLKNITLLCRIETIRAKSYGKSMISSGNVKINLELDDLQGKDIIILEDIVDNGFTLKALTDHLQKYNPRSVEIAVLLSKPEMRKVDLRIKYIGKDIPNDFVIGYGLDYAEFGRNLSEIYTLEDK